MPMCPDCGFEHDLEPVEHNLLCEARTCQVCMVSYTEVIPPDINGRRLCRVCQALDGTDGDAKFNSEESEEENGSAG